MWSRNPQLDKQLRETILFESLEKCKSVFWFIFWFSSGINILIFFLPLYTSQVLDRVLSSGSLETLILLTIITIASFLCSSLLEICRSIISIQISDWLDTKLSPYLIKKAIALTPLRPSTSSGEVIRDLQVIRGFITSPGIFSLFDAPWALLYLIAIFMIHPATGFIAIIGIVLLVGMALLNDFATKNLIKESNEKNVKNINDIEIATRNSEVVEAMGMLENILAIWSNQNNKNRHLQIKAQNRGIIIMGLTKAIRSVLQISVIGTGAFLAIYAGKTAGGIIAASILMGRVLAPFEMAIGNWKNLSNTKVSYNRLQMLILMAPERGQSMRLPDPIGAVEFDKVVYTPYGSSKPTIKGMSFYIPEGTIVGVIGNSAAGKSTIAKLLVGVLKPMSGVVRLDGADTYTWEREHFGSYIGYLPQDVELFNATIKDNIARFNNNINPERIVAAAKIAGIHEMILKLPEGYDTFIGSGGTVLSGGQRQRMGLARAFYGDIKLLVLDEPNANLDTAGEFALMGALKHAKTHKITTFVMTHKLALLEAVDVIMVVRDGMLAGIGNRDEILKQISSPPAAEAQQTKEVAPEADTA